MVQHCDYHAFDHLAKSNVLVTLVENTNLTVGFIAYLIVLSICRMAVGAMFNLSSSRI